MYYLLILLSPLVYLVIRFQIVLVFTGTIITVECSSAVYYYLFAVKTKTPKFLMIPKLFLFPRDVISLSVYFGVFQAVKSNKKKNHGIPAAA